MEGEITARAFNPLNWPKLVSTGWGRSELAAELYDEILFNDATFADLDRGAGPTNPGGCFGHYDRLPLCLQPAHF